MLHLRRIVSVVLVMLAILRIAAWTQEKKLEDVEGKIRATAFGYYSATTMGDAAEVIKTSRHPLIIIKDGVLGRRDEKATQALLAAISVRVKKSNISNEDRGRFLGNLIVLFDQASVQFVGARTAHLTFAVKFGAKESGDTLVTFILHRSTEGAWKVIGEITDSAPVPPSYLMVLP